MSRIILIIFFLFILLLAGAVIFILTIDIDQFRPRIVSQIESQIKLPVEIGRLSLGWKGGLAVESRNVKIAASTPETSSIQVDRISAVLQIWPLLQREIRVGSIIIEKPTAHLNITEDGEIRGFETVMEGGKEPVRDKKAALGLAFLISGLHIQNGILNLRTPEQTIEIQDIDLTAENLTLDGPIEISGRAAVLSEDQNLRVRGELRVASKDFSVRTENAAVDLNLGLIDLNRLQQAMPDLVLRQGDSLEGNLEARIRSFEFHPDRNRPAFDVRLNLNNASAYIAQQAISNLQADAVLTVDQLEIASLSAQIAGGQLAASGMVNKWQETPNLSLRLTLSNAQISSLVPGPPEGEAALEGILTFSLEGSAAQLRLQAFSGQGQIILKEGRIRNFNLVREVFSRISIIPGLVQRLQERLPPEYQEKIRQRDTVLEPVTLPFSVSGGQATFPNIEVASDTFRIRGSGTAHLAGAVRFSLTAFLDAEMSAAIIDSVREFQYLTDVQGRIGIPLFIQGTAPDIKLVPDLQYLAQQFAISKTSEIISGFLKKDQPQPTQTAPSPNPPSQPQVAQPDTGTPQGSLLGLLQAALENTQQTSPSNEI